MNVIRNIIFFTLFLPVALFGQLKKPKLEQKEFVQHYFKIDPEDHTTQEIVQFLEENMGFVIDSFIHRTDTSLLYLRAYSENYNPFSIPIGKIELLLCEKLMYNSHETVIDTLLTFQLIGIADSTQTSRQLLKDEFKRMNKTITKIYDHSRFNRFGNNKLGIESWTYYDEFWWYPKIRLINGNYPFDIRLYCISLEANYKLTID